MTGLRINLTVESAPEKKYRNTATFYFLKESQKNLKRERIAKGDILLYIGFGIG